MESLRKKLDGILRVGQTRVYLPTNQRIEPITAGFVGKHSASRHEANLISVCFSGAVARRMQKILLRMVISFTVCTLPAILVLVLHIFFESYTNPYRIENYSVDIKFWKVKLPLFEIIANQREFQSTFDFRTGQTKMYKN